jgi:N-acetylneuraminate synthase/sialic acid synthase
MYDILKNNFFVIAEIGHNHQGSLAKAKELFLEAKKAGANAVKLQKRDNKNLYTKDFYNQIYNSENSYGNTYGEHREALEFNEVQYRELVAYAKELDIDFFATPFDFSSVDFLERLDMPYYKIASADLTNLPLQEYIAKKNKPIFLSTGGGSLEDVKRAVNFILKSNKKLTLLHCTAAYPAPIEDMNLKVISTYKKEFPNLTIGLSDHENGIDASVVAYMLGARVFEKHFTLDRASKGTDHSFSLEPIGLAKFVRNLRRVDIMIGSGEKKLLDSEKKPLNKMYKSIVANKNLKAGHIINMEDINFKSPGGGLHPYMYKEILGKKINRDLNEDSIILLKYFE